MLYCNTTLKYKKTEILLISKDKLYGMNNLSTNRCKKQQINVLYAFTHISFKYVYILYTK